MSAGFTVMNFTASVAVFAMRRPVALMSVAIVAGAGLAMGGLVVALCAIAAPPIEHSIAATEMIFFMVYPPASSLWTCDGPGHEP